ncbi:MAG: DUF4430 domain-containing protein [Candidatus Methanomethylicia archaeon]|nr:DUF4430 domain-containing protein [Candidatus Methanomethylicia archaeon]
MGSRTPWIISFIMLMWALASTVVAVYYYNQSVDLSRKITDLNKLIENTRIQLNYVTSKLMRVIEGTTRTNDPELIELSGQLRDEIVKLHKLIGGTISVKILVDYGNGSRRWYNDTKISMGGSVFEALKNIVKVEYKEYPFGVFIEAIGGVYNDPRKMMYWMWWRWDSDRKMWILGEVACDKYIPVSGEIFAWKYTNVFEWPPKPP